MASRPNANPERLNDTQAIAGKPLTQARTASGTLYNGEPKPQLGQSGRFSPKSGPSDECLDIAIREAEGKI